MVDLVRKVTISYASEGDEKVAAAQQKVAAGHEKIAKSATSATVETEKLGRAQISASAALDRYTKQLDPLSRAAAQVATGERLIATARAQGQPVTEAAIRALENARQKHSELQAGLKGTAAAVGTETVALARSAAGHMEHARATGNNRIQMMEFEHSARAIADGLASGMSPMRLFAMEGARLAQAFGMGEGGVGGAFSRLAGFAGRLFAGPTGIGLGLGGVAAFGLASFVSWETQISKLEASLDGLGRRTGLSVAGLQRIASTGAAAGSLSTFSAQNLAAGYAGTGAIDPGLIAPLIAQTRNFANATGQGVPDAGAQLAKAFADPAKGAAELDKQLGFLDDRTLQLVEHLAASGHAFEAQGVLLRSLTSDIQSASDRTWTWTKIWQGLGEAASNALAVTGSAVQSRIDPTLDQRYAAARVAAANAPALVPSLGRNAMPHGVSAMADAQNALSTQNATSQALAAQADDLNEQIRRRNQQRDRDAETARANAASKDIGDLVRSIVPESGNRQTLLDQRDKLGAALGTPGALQKLGASSDDAQKALDILNNRIKFFQTSAEQVSSASTAAALATQAETANERLAIQSQKTYTDALRDTGDVTLAAAQALAQWNQAIAESNKRASDDLQSAQDEARRVGMTPYQRRIDEINTQYRDKRDELVTGQGAAAALTGAGAVTPAQAKMMRLLVGAGYGPAAAAGFVGGMTGESGIDLDPMIVNRTSGAYGIAQALGDRKRLYQSVAPTINAQGSVVLSELAGPERRAGSMLAGADTVAGGLAANLAFERPSKSEIATSYDKRLAAGQKLYDYATSMGLAPPVASTSVADTDAAKATRIKAAQQDMATGPINAASQALADQARILDVQAANAGKSKAQIDGLVAAQKLLNDYMDQGVPITDDLRRKIEAYGDATAQVAQREADQQKQSQGGADIRTVGGGFVDSILNGIANPGHEHSTILARALRGVGQNLLSMGERDINSTLFGNGKTAGDNGILGSALLSLFGNFHFADGGIMTSRGAVPLRRYAGGGVASSPQLAMYGEGSTPEAFVPLPDGRRIPVAMTSAPANQNGHTFNIGGPTINVAGSADEKTLGIMRTELARSQKQMERNLHTMVTTANRRYGAGAG